MPLNPRDVSLTLGAKVFQKLHDIKGPFDMLDAPEDSPDESPQGKKISKRSQSSKKQNKKKKLDFSTSGYYTLTINPANPIHHRWAFP